MNTSFKITIAFCLIFFSMFSSAQEANNLITKEELIEQLFDIGSIQFGDFVLKVANGFINTPIYIDMRRIMSYPHLLKKVVSLISDITKDVDYNVVCGVPYAALFYASGVSFETNKPMIMSRQIVKHYGTQRAVEGVYNKGDTVLLIEDVIVSGASVLAATDLLRHEGLKVKDVVVLCDREQGAIAKMIKHGLKPCVVFTISDLLSVLQQKGKIEPEICESVKLYIQKNQCN